MDNITSIAEMLSKEIEQELSTGHTLSDIEKVTRRLVQEIGRQAIARVVNAEAKRYPELGIGCPECGREMNYVRRRSAQLARELVILGDGAEWIWNLVTEHFPRAVQILDWFHATEYLMPVAKAAFSTEAIQTEWVARTKQTLWDGMIDEVIHACLDLVRTEDSSDPAFVAARYFDQNRQRLDYPAYRQQGYQIGSGTIESAAKQIGLMRIVKDPFLVPLKSGHLAKER